MSSQTSLAILLWSHLSISGYATASCRIFLDFRTILYKLYINASIHPSMQSLIPEPLMPCHMVLRTSGSTQHKAGGTLNGKAVQIHCYAKLKDTEKWCVINTRNMSCMCKLSREHVRLDRLGGCAPHRRASHDQIPWTPGQFYYCISSKTLNPTYPRH